MTMEKYSNLDQTEPVVTAYSSKIDPLKVKCPQCNSEPGVTCSGDKTHSHRVALASTQATLP